jgi:hypothetical protein
MNLEPAEIARRRAIQRLDLSNGKGVIVAGGEQFTIRYDDLLDLVQAVEMIMLCKTGKVLNPQFRAVVTNRERLRIEQVQGGDYTLYDNTQGPAACEPWNPCHITQQMLKAHYLLVRIGGVRWDNWFCRLDELVKCLYVIVKEAQEEPAYG